MRRLFHPDSGRSLVVALDHGFFGVPSDLPAIESLAPVLARVVETQPDGVLLAAGQVRLLAATPGRPPAVTIRGDITNLYHSPPQPEADLRPNAGLEAVRADASALLVNLLDADDDPRVRESCMRNLFAARAACDRFGLNLMVEPIPFVRTDGRYHDVADPGRLVPLVRQAVEAGADIIKAGILADEAEMRRAVKVCDGVPYLARGGSKADDRAVLELTRHLLDCGARGVVYGRNIHQHAQPTAMVAALKAIVHDDASAEDAAKLLG
jgi:DhnA family fructose-bisphosphate aldolase class Ia